MSDFIVSTGEIKKDYEVLGTVFEYHYDSQDKDKFGRELTAVESFDAIKGVLVNKAKEMGGNAITFLRYDPQYAQHGYAAGTKHYMYGTAVKIKD